jgi:hypothetical protein
MSINTLRIPKGAVGIAEGLEWAARFIGWASSHQHPPTPQQIEDEFGVSRATSYRYHAAWLAIVATGSVRNVRIQKTEANA